MITQRLACLNSHPVAAGPLVYWMSREQRVADNWGLWYAQQLALERRQPLVVIFTLADRFLGATERHYGFMLRGLEQVRERLEQLAIPFIMLRGNPPEEIVQFVIGHGVGGVVTDFDPLRIKRGWREALAQQLSVAVIEVDGHNIIPCRFVSPKREYGAYTLRPKLKRLIPEFLHDIPPVQQHPFPWPGGGSHFPVRELLAELTVDRTIGEVTGILPGERCAQGALGDFIARRLDGYAERRNDPVADGQSGLSPWLHFGQLSPQRVALAVAGTAAGVDGEAFLEELIVRRELSDNFCWYTPDYDHTSCFPDWAQRTLDSHRSDPRIPWYGRERFEGATTDDPLWNSAQREMMVTGKMHGYLRMYWAKKILEWSPTPEEAMATAIYLNDRYSLDGRDPNGYAGIAWSIGGVHDRAWGERPVFGSIRYMNFNGCKRKFDVASYIRRWEP